MALAIGGFDVEFFQRQVRLGRQQRADIGLHLGVFGRSQLHLGQGAVGLWLELGLVDLQQRLHRWNVQVAGRHDHFCAAHGLVVERDVTQAVGQAPGHQAVFGRGGTGVFKVFDLEHRLGRAGGQLRLAQLQHVLAQVETVGAFVQVAGQGQPAQLDRYRWGIGRRGLELEVVHVAFGFEVLGAFIGLGAEVQARETDAGFIVQRKVEGQQLQLPVHRTTVAQGDLADKRRLVLGGGEPFFGEGGFLKGVVADRHDRRPLEGLDARPRQRAVLDVIDKQQLNRLWTRTFGIILKGQAIVRGAAVEVGLNGHQFDAAVGRGAGQLSGHFFVGLCDRGLEFTFDLGAGVPGASRVQNPCDYNNADQYA